jgi:hypothetical protein
MSWTDTVIPMGEAICITFPLERLQERAHLGYLGLDGRIMSNKYSSAVCIETGYGLDSSNPDRRKNFLFSMSFRQVLYPTQPPKQLVTGVLSTGGGGGKAAEE